MDIKKSIILITATIFNINDYLSHQDNSPLAFTFIIIKFSIMYMYLTGWCVQ